MSEPQVFIDLQDAVNQAEISRRLDAAGLTGLVKIDAQRRLRLLALGRMTGLKPDETIVAQQLAILTAGFTA
jgi:hypothetical protein